MIKYHAARISHLVLGAGVVVSAACRHAQNPRYVSISSDAVSSALPVPPCVPGAPTAFRRHHEATIALDGAPSWGRLLIRVVSADPAEPPPLGPFVSIRHTGAIRAAALQPSGLYLTDSLDPGRVILDVRAIGFALVRDTVLVRTSYVDTVEAGLMRPCK